MNSIIIHKTENLEKKSEPEKGSQLHTQTLETHKL